jgi:hypothetical protein
MKNLLFILIFNSFAFVSNAQIINANETNNRNQKETTIYCDIESRHFYLTFSERVSIYVDFGESQKDNNRFMDSGGNTVDFKSIVDALNFMSKEGWSLVNTYNFTDPDTKVLQVHYLMSKKVILN